MLNLSNAELLALLELAEASAPVQAAPKVSQIEPADRSGPLPLSFAQWRLWFLDQLGIPGAIYHIPTYLPLRGELDRDALVRALDRIVARHEALRTTFTEVDGEQVQRIAPVEESPFQLAEHDLRGRAGVGPELRRLLEDDAGAPFDLERGPLIRGCLIRLTDVDQVLHITMHHIVSDGWSMGVFTRELGELYAAFRAGEPDPLPALPIQYADYAVWQRSWVNGEVLKAQAEYWKETLAGVPELLELPTDRPRPARQDFTGGETWVDLDAELTAGLKALGRRHGVTLYMTFLAAWAVVLSRLSGQESVVIGTPVAGRGRREIEGLIGFFVNTLAIRADLTGSPTVAELLGRVKTRALEAQQNQDIPFEQVVELLQPVRSLAHTPLFQVMFNWLNTPERDLKLSGLALAYAGASPGSEPAPASATQPGAPSEAGAQFDLSLTLSERGGRIGGPLDYATALFDPETIERHVAYLRRVLAQMVADDRRSVAGLALMSPAERAQVVEGWNATALPSPDGWCVHELFERRAEETPGAVAVAFEGGELTYARLNARANRLAHRLRALGVGPDARVAICAERTPEMVAGLLAVLKAGGAYLPLDPAYPEERLRWLLGDSAPVAVLAHASLAARFAGAGVPVLELDAGAPVWAEGPETNPGRGALLPEHLAYVIYTSGSTGRPKGVMVPHRAVQRQAAAVQAGFGLRPDDRVLQFASIAFDAAVEEIFGALAAGAALVLRTEAWIEGAHAFWARCAENRVTVADLPTRFWQLLLDQPSAAIPPCVRLLAIGGEAVETAALEAWFRRGGHRPPLLNTYGPTETTVNATLREIAGDRATWRSIGRPVANTRVYLLDTRGEPVPVGVAGELYVGGAQVARGYLDRPGLTAGRFVPDPFAREPGARLYRTGDLGRWLADGSIEFAGRTDFQVKIRGFRIELGEIEARLAEHPAVRDAVVLAREDAPGEKRLVAYCVADEGLDVESLRAHLAGRLPSYMVPAAFVRLDAFPVTAGGKVDRRALPAPEGDALATGGYEAPEGAAEQVVADIWAEVLRVERVGRRDSFFDLGGHSLLAVQVISRVRQRLAVEVALRDLFSRPVLADFARGLASASRAELPPIVPVERGADLPLAFAQQRLWFLERLGGLGDTYHIATRLWLEGDLDRVALRRALDAMLARHEALRTTFVEVGGEPVQRIARESAFHLVEHDLAEHPDAAAELRRLAAEEAGDPFDLEHGPLIRGRLVHRSADEHVLLLTMHHIVADGWSMKVLTRELATLYEAFRRGEANPLPPLPVQYADYAAWQRSWVAGDVLREQAEYWREMLAGAPELLELPADRPRPARQDHAGASVGVVIDEELTAGLKALGRRQGTTLFMTVLAGWAAVLGRLSGQPDVVVGTPSANRGRAEIEGLIGFFVNTLALRVDLSGSPTVAELLAQVRVRALGAQQNQDIPFEQVVELVQPVRSMAHTPLFQVMFSWQEARPELAAPGAGGAGAAAKAGAKFDLSLSLGEAGGRIAGTLTYATALFEQATVERYVGYLRRVLAGMAADADGRVEQIRVLSEAERREVTEAWNATAVAYPREACVHELFEAQVEKTPHAPALAFEGEALTYAELNARANRLAHHLRALGVGPDVRVGLCVERSLEMMVGLLGVLKAGGAYVALDPEYPDERLRYMLADSAPAVVLTRGPSPLERLGGLDVPVVALDRDAARWADRPATNPERAGVTAGHLAYLIYTSGSTGRPKGVMVEHRSLANVLAWMRDAWPLGGHDVVLQKTPYSFDASLRELIPPLLAGARMVIARPGGHRDAGYLLKTIRREAVTTLHFVPSMLQVLVEDAALAACTSVERVVCGGEPMPPGLVRDFHRRLPRARLYNVYGPTEAAVDVTAWSCPAAEARERIPIGRPMANTRAYVLDAAGEPVPAGVVGELYLGGVQVARGYQGRPELTAERFVADPFGEPGARLYRTGDLARWVGDGALEVLGRADAQVKVRGFRIELGEIEARLKEHPRVREAAVLAREDEPGNRRLVAYYVVDGAADVDALRAHLAQGLPEHMVPAAYVELEALPRTPNGKLDRNALPAPEGDAFARRGYEAPESDSEAALAEIWSEVLGVEGVGRRDSFFELGGHSLLAVRVVSRVRQLLGVEVALGELFRAPVLADLARAVDDAARTELPPIERVDRGGRLPLSFAQQRLWFLERLGGLGDAYHIPRQLRLAGELDRDALHRALDAIVARHEALRTTFVEAGGEPVQRIAGESRFHLVEHDLGGHPHAAAELRRLAADEVGTRFDLERGPLVRGRLVRLAADDHVLLITMHHVVSDGWSTGVFTRELGALYGAFRRGEPDPLPPLPVQYADYAAWQRKWVDGEVLREQAEYWKETLGGAPAVLELPLDHPRPARQDYAGAFLPLELDGEMTAGLKALGRRHGTTLFMTVLAGWAAVLARLSGQEDVVVGTPSANRGRAEIEGLIGFFINTLALRVDLAGSPSVAELLGRVKGRALGAQQNQDIPFEQVVELVQPVRSMAHSPLFQAMFSWQNAPESRLELPGLALAPLPQTDAADVADVADVGTESSATAKFDLSLFLFERGGRISGGMTYATSLFEQASVERHLAYLHRVLAAMAADDLQGVGTLPLLPEAERRLVVEEWNATDAAYPRDTCVHELVEAQAARAPDAVAVVFDGGELTYGELNAHANRLAHHLRDLGVGPDARVAICVERGPAMVVGLLAILKAGGGYVPLDPSYPAERLRYMLHDSAPAAVLTQGSLEGVEALFADVDVPVVDLESAEWADRPATNPSRAGIEPHHLAYVIYTSGSTGMPKGVMIEHRSLANHTAWQAGAFGVGPDDTVLQRTSISFDASVWELWTTLASGARMLLLSPAAAKDPAAIGRATLEGGVTIAQFVPTLLQAVLTSLPEGGSLPCRILCCGGEPLSAALVNEARAAGAGRVVNLYGPTEATIDSTWDVFGSAADGRVPAIGRPIANARIYVLDARGEPVPAGVSGELYVGGAGLARGYLGRHGLTAERFVPDPFSVDGGARMYRTGDLGRWRADGTLEFLGRTDFQVKLRGYRIELGEIEAALRSHDAVRDAVVLAREDAPGDRRLVAYIVAPDSVEADALRESLAERLPEHMVPAAYVRLEALPLTPSGKVDRKALPAPEGDAFVTRGYEAPVGNTEQALAEIWAEVLGVERVGRNDHFFKLGGHSLLAVRVISHVRQALGVEVAIADLFEKPVLSALAQHVVHAMLAQFDPEELAQLSALVDDDTAG
jgi:amino acid adenylation domain-containing protein